MTTVVNFPWKGKALRMLTSYLTTDHIWLGFEPVGPEEALKDLCLRAANLCGQPFETIWAGVLAREAMGSTGLGGGVALPHSKIKGLTEPLLLLAVSQKGVEFNSLDGQPIHVFVMILTPDDGGNLSHLWLLARLGGLFKSGEAVGELLEVNTPEKAYEVVARRS